MSFCVLASSVVRVDIPSQILYIFSRPTVTGFGGSEFFSSPRGDLVRTQMKTPVLISAALIFGATDSHVVFIDSLFSSHNNNDHIEEFWLQYSHYYLASGEQRCRFFCLCILPGRVVIIVNMNVPIDPGSSGMMARAVSQARSSGASALIIDMNTPGGLLSDMLSIVDSIGNSSVPVYTYVGNDSLAASAGSDIAMATTIIFMGPGSEIGPSTPIVEGGTALQQNHTASAMLLFMSSLAEKNNRNTTAASNMVLYDIAFSQQQALQYHVADRASNSLAQTIDDLNLSSAAAGHDQRDPERTAPQFPF